MSTIYDKSSIRVGTFLELDCPIRAHIPRAPNPSPFAEVSERLDAARVRLEALVTEVRDARRQ